MDIRHLLNLPYDFPFWLKYSVAMLWAVGMHIQSRWLWKQHEMIVNANNQMLGTAPPPEI